MNNRRLYILAASLTLLGLGVFLYKVSVLKYPLLPDTQSDLWDIEVRVDFVARGEPVKVALFIPRSTRRYAIEDEHFVSRGYGVRTKKLSGNRQVVWSARKARGQQALYYRATVRNIRGTRSRIADKDPSGEQTRPGAEKPVFEGPYLAAAESVIADIRARSADVDSMVFELFKRLNEPKAGDDLGLLLGAKPLPAKKMEVAAEVLRLAGIRARAVHGIRLQELQRNAPVIHWLQVYENKRWRSFNPETGERQIPDDYFTWWRGMESLVDIEGAKKLPVQISVSLNREMALAGAPQRTQLVAPALYHVSLFSLPIGTQAVYHVLLLVPVGAFLLVVLRNVVGVKTFGTFMPVLIALAFRETQLAWGIALFCIVVGLGLSVRFYLEQLKLLVVPRLASVLIVVVIVMALLSILSHKMGLERGLSVALFPMVIMTMTVERMSIVWEERGVAEALQQGLGSLAVAALAYVVMTNRYMDHIAFIFPELLLVLLAGTLLLGRYSGYRLLELKRFRVLAEDRK